MYNTTSNSRLSSNGTRLVQNAQDDYDAWGAMEFIVATISVYALLGILSLLLVRIVRRAKLSFHQDGHNEEFHSVRFYLRERRKLQLEGHRQVLMHEKMKTSLTLWNTEIPRLTQPLLSTTVETQTQTSNRSSSSPGPDGTVQAHGVLNGTNDVRQSSPEGNKNSQKSPKVTEGASQQTDCLHLHHSCSNEALVLSESPTKYKNSPTFSPAESQKVIRDVASQTDSVDFHPSAKDTIVHEKIPANASDPSKSTVVANSLNPPKVTKDVVSQTNSCDLQLSREESIDLPQSPQDTQDLKQS